jgi:hypothetical protein
MKSVRTVAAMLALAALTVRAEQTKFDAPRANGYRVDACRSWGQGCGKEAADAFCRLNNFESASTFEIDPRIGASTPTMTIADRKICNQPQCDGFKSITCTRPDGAPGRRRVPPSTQPEPQPSAPPAGQPSEPRVRIPRGLSDALKKPGDAMTPTPAPNTPAPNPAPGTPAPRAPRSPVALARLDPAEFVIIKPKSSTATLGRFGAAAPTGQLEEARTVPLKTNADMVQTAAADVDGDGQSELLLLETNPLKPEQSELRFLKLTGDLAFAPIGQHGVFLGKSFPILTTGRFIGGERSEQALVYAPGQGAAILAWRPGSATTLPVDYVIVEGAQPKGAWIVLDATGDGQDDILDYTEAGSLDLVTLGPIESSAAGERLVRAVSRPLLMLGPKQQFGVGDFTGDGRTDLLIHDAKTFTVSIAQFDNTGAVRSRTPAATEWPPTYLWVRGYDYDADGRDDLVINDPSVGFVALARFTSEGILRDTKILVPGGYGDTENLRFHGYFMANGRASLLTHVRSKHLLNHFWFESVGEDVVMRPMMSEPARTLVKDIPDGALVVVGNFRRDR